jgi:hypothetical protein
MKENIPMKRLLTALLALSLPALTHAQTYDATTDFSITQGNANGAWSYGFSSTLGGALTLFDVTDSFPSWKHSVVQNLGCPTIGRNDTGPQYRKLQPLGAVLYRRYR